MFDIDMEEKYLVCYFDGEYNYFESDGKSLEEWLLRTTVDVHWIFKTKDAVYED